MTWNIDLKCWVIHSVNLQVIRQSYGAQLTPTLEWKRDLFDISLMYAISLLIVFLILDYYWHVGCDGKNRNRTQIIETIDHSRPIVFWMLKGKTEKICYARQSDYILLTIFILHYSLYYPYFAIISIFIAIFLWSLNSLFLNSS